MSEDQFKTLKEMIEAMRKSMESRFEQVDQRFEKVDQRFLEVERRIDKIETAVSMKPDSKDIYMAVFTIMGGTMAMIVGSMVLANIFGAFN